IEGPAAQIDQDAERAGGERRAGLQWPSPPPGEVTAAVTVPPASTAAAVGLDAAPGSFVAQHGVGRADVAGSRDAHWATHRRRAGGRRAECRPAVALPSDR